MMPDFLEELNWLGMTAQGEADRGAKVRHSANRGIGVPRERRRGALKL
jgi:hypothetical protein